MNSIKTALILCVLICTQWALTAGNQALAGEYDERVQLQLQKGLNLREEGKPAEARREFQEILKIEPECPEAYNNIGLTYRDEGLLEKAAENYRQALKIDPDFTYSMVNIGDVLYTMGQKNDALIFLKKAAGLSDPPDADIYAVMGNIYRDQGKYSDALKEYKKALKIAPDSAIAYNNLGQTLLYMKRYKDAKVEVLKAIKLRPDYPQAFYNLGHINLKLGNRKGAIRAFKDSLKHESDPEYAAETRQLIREISQASGFVEHMAKGHDLIESGKWQAAESEFQEAIKSGAGKDPVAWNNLGLARARQKKLDEAITCYKKAISLKPGGLPAAYYNLGQALRSKGDGSGAEANFKDAIKHAKGRHPEAHAALGILLKQKGDYEGARKQYSLAILQSGDSMPVVHLNLGLVLELMDESRKAVEEYKTYLSKAPSGKRSRVARARLKRLGISPP